MTKPTPKKLNRRDAIKILGAAAGASVLANLPSKWSAPELVQGSLPAHAQTSGALLSILSCGAGDNCPSSSPAFTPSTVVISQTLAGVSMAYTITNGTNGDIGVNGGPAQAGVITGTQNTNVGGLAIINLEFFGNSGSATVQWGFADPLQGTGTCNEVFNFLC